MNLHPDESIGPPPVNRLWWSIPAVLFVGMFAIAFFFGEALEKPAKETSYDPSDSGFRALYLLLDELQIPIAQSRRVTGGQVRWLLAPKKGQPHDAAALREWVRTGGRLLLGPTDEGLIDQLELPIRADHESSVPLSTSMADVKQLTPGSTHADWSDGGKRVWASAGDEPLVSIRSLGSGEVWLLHRPRALANENLRKSDNAVFACRLAEAMLEGRTGDIALDEFFHGMRERPGVVELLWQPPLRYVTIQALILALLIIWRSGVRFGPLAPLPPVRRRSKEEFLDAYATLLHRQKDSAAAFRTVQQDLTHRLAAEMGLPDGTKAEDVALEAARRRGADPEKTVRLLTASAPPGGKGSAALLHSLNELEAATRELLRNR